MKDNLSLEEILNAEESVRYDLVAEGDMVLSKDEYDELRMKADRLDLLAEDIRRNLRNGAIYGVVNAELVRILTGTMDCTAPVSEKGDSDE